MELSKKIYSFERPATCSEKQWEELQPKQQQIVHGLAAIQRFSEPLATKLVTLFKECNFDSSIQASCDSCNFTFSVTSHPSCVNLTVTTSDLPTQSPFPLFLVWAPADQTEQNRPAEAQLKIALDILSQSWKKPTASLASSAKKHPQTLRGKAKEATPPLRVHQRSNSLTLRPSQGQVKLLIPCVLDQLKKADKAGQKRSEDDLSLSMKNGQFRQQKQEMDEIEKLMATLPDAKWKTSEKEIASFCIEYRAKNGELKVVSAKNLAFLRHRLASVCHVQNKDSNDKHPSSATTLDRATEEQLPIQKGSTATNWAPLLIAVALVGLGAALWKIRQASTKPTKVIRKCYVSVAHPSTIFRPPSPALSPLHHH